MSGLGFDRARARLTANEAAIIGRAIVPSVVVGVFVQLSYFTGPFASMLAPIAIVVAIVVHAIVLRVGLLAPANQASASRGYDAVRRWVIRLGYLLLAPWAYGLMATPLLGVAAGPASAVGITWLVARYLHWTLERERTGAGISVLEKLLVLCFAALVFAGIVVVALFAGAIGLFVTTVFAEVGGVGG